MGITNTFGSIPGFVAPLAVGALTENNVSLFSIPFISIKEIT